MTDRQPWGQEKLIHDPPPLAAPGQVQKMLNSKGMTDTRTGTRTFAFTREQISLIAQWATNAWHDADQARLTSRIDSPQEKSHLADQQFIETIQEKLRG